MNIGAIFLAAGTGQRYGDKTPKQFHLLGERQVYQYGLDVILSSNLFSSIVVALPPSYEKKIELAPSCTVVAGGKTRQESVLLSLQALKNVDGVIICEAARPFLTKELLIQHKKMLCKGAIAINTYIPCTDTISIQQKGVISAIPPRSSFLKGQTPQSFSYEELLSAHIKTNSDYTDDCALMLDEGFEITKIMGSSNNLKITTSFDLKIAEAYLASI